MTQVATFNLPWRIAFLPDGRMLITEKPGAVWLVTQQGAKTPVAERAGRPAPGSGRHAGRVPVAALRHRPQRLPDLCGTGRRRVEPRARPGPADDRRGHGEPGRTGGAVAPDAQGQGRTVRRPDRLFSRRPVSVPDGRRAPAHDTRPGSGPGAGQDPAPDARRQARAGQSDGGEDGRGQRSADRSAARYGGGQDRARGQHLHVPRAEPGAGGDLEHRSPHALRPGVRARRPAVGGRARPAEAATS